MTNKHSYGKVGLQKDHGRSASASAEAPEAERRPGGMVVQKRDGDDDDARQQPIQIRVSYGPSLVNLSLPSTSTFGDVKRHLSQEVGLDPSEQRLFYRGIEKEDNVLLGDAGVKNLSKLLLREVEASKEKKLAEIKKKEEISRACEAISRVTREVDQLSDKVASLEGSVLNGSKVPEKEFLLLEELLMRQLLKLDGIEAEEAAKEQRRQEVRRIQSLEKKLEAIKERNTNPFSNNNKSVSVTTQWETFDSGVGSLNPPPAPSSANPTQDWEQFD
uniref:BAG family molecular chaperone regulator 4 n=1 Tax=Kalanchoe fedtschenkoi TaxID=63787 RepID=A0A7N0T8I9_KALFE